MKRALVILAALACAGAAQAAGNAEAGKTIASQVCAACHGPEGNKPTAPENPILAGQHQDYLAKALSPFADVQEPRGAKGTADSIAQLLDAQVSVLVLADVGAMDERTTARVEKFVQEGGLLLRFAGPRLAAGNDPLVPVRLRRGGRSLGGKRIFGDHKTWRGVVTALLTAVAVYEAQRLLYAHGVGIRLAAFDYSAYPIVPGLLMGLGTGVGDAVKSFFKRRVGIPPGAS